MNQYQNYTGQILGATKNGETRQILADDNGILLTSQQNQTLVETFTQADAIAGVLTFSENISCIEVFNTDAVNTGTFNVNGLEIVVPPSTPFKTVIGGIASNIIIITGSTTYIVNRYI